MSSLNFGIFTLVPWVAWAPFLCLFHEKSCEVAMPNSAGAPMQKGHSLQFDCISCNHPIHFSIFQLENSKAPLCCHFCERQYFLEDSTLCRQLKKFEALCRQIVESEEILGTASIGIDIEEHQVKIPYKLLLTRFNSCIELMIGDQPITIVFRLEPAIDLPYPINR